MSGNPYGNPQYPNPQNPIYPTLYNPTYAPQPGHPAAMSYPAPGPPQYGNPGFAYPYQPGQPPTMAYPSAPTAPPTGFPSVTPVQTSPFPSNSVEWVPSTIYQAPSLGDRVVVGGYEGYDGSPLWVIRARFENDLIPGKLAVKHNAAYVAWGGNENAVEHFEVCCARPDRVRWLECRDGSVPPNAVIAGNTASGEPLYVGRARHDRSLTPGKVHRSHGCVYISYGGDEIPYKSYEVLCTV